MSFSAALRRNVLILSACQALMLSGSSLIVATSALTGLSLATNSLLATVPLSCMYVGTLLTTFPCVSHDEAHRATWRFYDWSHSRAWWVRQSQSTRSRSETFGCFVLGLS